MKHLNPRQGITTGFNLAAHRRFPEVQRVKHLNPRQGITTLLALRRFLQAAEPEYV